MFCRSLSIATSLLCAAGIASAADWSDIEGRIQYAWFTQDARALHAVVASLEGGGDSDALQAYYRGLGEYRMALLAQDRDRNEAGAAAEACSRHLGAASALQEDFAEALALQATCQTLVASLKAWKAPLLAPRSAAQFGRARALAPRNPRVLLLEALADSNRERAFGRLQAAVAAFEAERQGIAAPPAWGAPEAWLQLAHARLDRGEVAAARSALERALLLAPEFELARRLMASITAN